MHNNPLFISAIGGSLIFLISISVAIILVCNERKHKITEKSETSANSNDDVIIPIIV